MFAGPNSRKYWLIDYHSVQGGDLKSDIVMLPDSMVHHLSLAIPFDHDLAEWLPVRRASFFGAHQTSTSIR